MKTDGKKKRFDCVEMKRRIQEQIYDETKGLTPEEVVAYFHRRVEQGPFADLWKQGAAKPAQATSSRSSTR